MGNLELLNNGELGNSKLSQVNIEDIQTMFTEMNHIKDKLLTKEDTYKVNNKTYINKNGYRKLAVAFSISIQIISENRIENGDDIIYNFTIRASTPLGRYVESSSSCSSRERDFNNVEHEVRTISQTRASNRAIGELIGLSNISFIPSDENQIKKTTAETGNDISNNEITAKQKRLLIKLIESKYQDELSRNAEYKKVDGLNKSQARIIIRDLIEEGVEY